MGRGGIQRRIQRGGAAGAGEFRRDMAGQKGIAGAGDAAGGDRRRVAQQQGRAGGRLGHRARPIGNDHPPTAHIQQRPRRLGGPAKQRPARASASARLI